jgi:hypothetical protein
MMTAFAGPLVSWGFMDYLLAQGSFGPSPDFNQDAGPSFLYNGYAVPDLRFLFQKDSVSGKTGVVPAFLNQGDFQNVNSIPAAFGTAIIAALQNVTNGTAMTLATGNTIAIATNIPIVPIGGGQNAWQSGPVVTAPLVLDPGFAYATATANQNTWTVANSSDFVLGQPLVIAGAGAAGGPLLTWVTGAPTTTTITTNDNCVTAVTAVPVMDGNIWTPREGISTIYPTAHVPYRAGGIGAFLYPAETIARGVSITGSSGAAGGAFSVSGWDMFWQPMHETITAAAGAGPTYGKKAFKAIASVTPQFTDAHNYSIGTSDVFGLAFYQTDWEATTVCWAAADMTSSTGFTAGLSTLTAPTATTADVRGTIQTSAQGGGSGIGTTNSNGTVVSLARSGNRLYIANCARFLGFTAASPFNPVPMMGQVQF